MYLNQEKCISLSCRGAVFYKVLIVTKRHLYGSSQHTSKHTNENVYSDDYSFSPLKKKK